MAISSSLHIYTCIHVHTHMHIYGKREEKTERKSYLFTQLPKHGDRNHTLFKLSFTCSWSLRKAFKFGQSKCLLLHCQVKKYILCPLFANSEWLNKSIKCLISHKIWHRSYGCFALVIFPCQLRTHSEFFKYLSISRYMD